MSMRYDRIDNFWFVLGHELEHIKNNDKSIDERLVGRGAQPTEEKPLYQKAADEMASTFLISERAMNEFMARHRPKYSKTVIEGFAKRLGVHPGIVVGHDSIVPGTL